MNRYLSLFLSSLFVITNASGATVLDLYLGPKLPSEQLAKINNPDAIINFIDELGSQGLPSKEALALPGKHVISIQSKTSRDAIAMYVMLEAGKEYNIVPRYQDKLWRPEVVEKLSGKTVSWMGFIPVTDLKAGASRAQVEEMFEGQTIRASYSYEYKNILYRAVHYNVFPKNSVNDRKGAGTDFVFIYRPDDTVFFSGTFTGNLLRSNDPEIQKMLPMIKEGWANAVYGPPVVK
ncbi:hypothetical protein UNDYM_3875 [Undibacterium sp. YM2]|uniref:hypothetical protein n=1 Tax=Undibacterium sp. YM2 TaxID=2058625 RepID=UPI001331E267|nr:hypothetical protein [Undibacterium sp. YM2]BBB68128.1 hypothetical protein UNDYM_3875 [Undibacterium sp. YM2]